MRNDLVKATLSEWLEHIGRIHPREIELGLDRIKKVANVLGLERPAGQVITIAGTNGKGTCVACLERLLEESGLSTAAYTSPHLHQFNERIRVRGVDADDSLICLAFSEIEEARENVSLSYFEYATLAALWIFSQQVLDYIILEVGLGGRLDAVNIVDANIALITSISLDHEEWLGSDLEKIGFEKAGIMRQGVPTVFADYKMPVSITNRAEQLNSPLYSLGREFDATLTLEGMASWSGLAADGASEEIKFLMPENLHSGSVAACLQVLRLQQIDIDSSVLNRALAKIKLPGRFEQRVHLKTGQSLILDVAHNPAAAQLLNRRLQRQAREFPETGKFIAVLAVLNDKDIEGIVVSLQSAVDIWYIAQIDDQRALTLAESQKRLESALPELTFIPFETVQEALDHACEAASADDKVVVAGSFHTVAIARENSRAA